MNTNHKCPECSGVMRPVKVSTHLGQPFEVEQCESCGGMWFDKSECHRLHADDIDKLDTLDEGALEEITKPTDHRALCPKDKTELIPFEDRYFPRDLRIDHCIKCDGLFFNRGEYSAYRNAYKKDDKDKEERNAVKKLAMAYLIHNSQMKRKEIHKTAKEAVTREVIMSFITFLLIKKPTAAIKSITLITQPIYTLLMKLLGVSHEKEKIYIDLDEFKTLVNVVSKNDTISNQDINK